MRAVRGLNVFLLQFEVIMKLSTLSAVAFAALVSANAFANDVVFKAMDDNLATQTCIVAAKDGIQAAKQLVSDNGLRAATFTKGLKCNDQNLTRFAKKYAKQDMADLKEQAKATRVVRLVTSMENVETQLCIDAAVMGEERARAKYRYDAPVTCNSKSLSTFVREFKNTQFESAQSEE
jgi:hypothetical protein